MKKLIFSLIAAIGLVTGAHASEGGIAWDKAPNNTNDLGSLQNGAKLFVNYCLNCHSAAFMRFNRLKDIGLTDQQIKDNLLFTTEKVGDTMKAAIDPKQAKDWFGGNPPDLTVIARSRAGATARVPTTFTPTCAPTTPTTPRPRAGTTWLSRAWPCRTCCGNCRVFAPRCTTKKKSTATKWPIFKGWKQVTPGTMTPLQYDQAMGDLVGYLQWMAEPAQNTRIRVGVWVLLFLLCLTFVAWRLNAAFWKDVK
jgi:ubiquinol-cytochrome c reductase cytochrome c1 subunit